MAYGEIDDDGGDDTAQLSPLSMLMGAGFNTVTPEGKAKATEVFGDLYSKRSGYDTAEQDAYNNYEARAQEARQVLQRAREALAAKKTPTTKWLEMAKGFGSSTRTGSFGESVANYASARIPGRQQEEAYESGRDKDLLGLDTGMNQIDQTLATQRIKMQQLRKAADDKLMIESMKIMGKPTPAAKAPPRTLEDRATEKLDAAYAKDYLEWNQGGSAEADKQLRQAEGALTNMGSSNKISGPVVGLIPKWARDLFLPKASETQEAVESTIQGTLRQILGAQYTQVEGENLLARTYNPRLDEKINARRAQRLIGMLKQAKSDKDAIADYYETHGSLKGYRGRIRPYSISEFEPENGAADDIENPFMSIYNEAKDLVGIGGKKPTAARPAAQAQPPAQSQGDMFWEDGEPAKARGGKVGYAEGGQVQLPDGRKLFTMPDGKTMNVPPQVSYTQALQRWQSMTGAAMPDPDMGLPPQVIPPREGVPNLAMQQVANQAPQAPPQELPQAPLGQEEQAPEGPGAGEMAFDAGAAALGGAAGARVVDRVGQGTRDMLPGQAPTPGQRRVMDVMQDKALTPAQLRTNLAAIQRSGVPGMMLDTDPSMRALSESALSQSGGPNATEALRRLQARQGAAGDRVSEVVNQGLKPDEFFDQQEKLKDSLYTNAKPLYDAAYAKHPAIQSSVLPEILSTPDGKKAVKAALRIMRNEGKKIGKADAVGMVRAPSLEFLDKVKQGFDQIITQEEGSGVNYKATPLGSSMRKVRDRLRDELDTSTTDAKGNSLYKQAREQYSGDLEVLDALRAGREDFHKLAPKQVEKMVGGMSFAEKDAFRTGAAQRLFETIESPTADTNPAQRVIGSDAMRKRLRPLFDTDAQFRLFETAMDREQEIFQESKGTINRARAGQAASVEPKPGFVQRMFSNVPRLGLKSPVAWALKLVSNATKRPDDEYDEIAKYMKSATPDELADFDRHITKKLARQVSRTGRRGKVGMAGAAVGAGTALAHDLIGDDDDAE